MTIYTTTSFNYSSFATTGTGVIWNTAYKANASVFGSAQTDPMVNEDITDYIISYDWNDLVQPANTTLVGVDFLTDYFDATGFNVLQASSYLSFNFVPGVSAPIESALRTSPFITVDDGTGHNTLITGISRDLYGLTDVNSLQAILKGNFAVGIKVRSADGTYPDLISSQAVMGLWHWDDTPTFRDRGSSRSRLMWGVR